MRLGLEYLHRFDERSYAARFLQGDGIEIGACHICHFGWIKPSAALNMLTN